MALPTSVPPDPLESPVWDAMVERFLSAHPIVFDPSIDVGLPPVTEDQTQVPITVDGRKLGAIDEMIVLGDLSPFPLTVKVVPKGGAAAYVSFRMRVEQATVIRAAALKNGQWHVNGRFLDAAGGGCSVPPVVAEKTNWDQIGQMRGKVWRESADLIRLRLRIVHPMDTGLQKNPAFYIHSVDVSDADGKPLGGLETHEPIGENPTLTLLLPDPKKGDHLVIAAKDTDGGSFSAKVPMNHLVETRTTPFREGRL